MSTNFEYLTRLAADVSTHKRTLNGGRGSSLLSVICDEDTVEWFGQYFKSRRHKAWLEDICHIIVTGKGSRRQLTLGPMSKIDMKNIRNSTSGLMNIDSPYPCPKG
jgi:hypothetical protein